MNLVQKTISNTIAYERQLEIVAKEKEYRANSALNYSSIKDFDEHGPLQFYKRHIAKEKEPKKESDAMDMGSLVDCLLTVPDTFDDRYFVHTANETVKGQNKELVEEMFNITKLYYNEEDGTTAIPFGEIFKQAFENVQLDKFTGEQVKFKGKTWEVILGTFSGGPMEDFYTSLIENISKKGVSMIQVDMAQNIVKSILSVPCIHDIYNRTDVEIHNQYPLYFEYQGFKMKGLLDTVHINHDEKWVQEFDLKTSWTTLNFGYNRLSNRYYIQEAVYNKGLELAFPGYVIRPRKYIIADSRNNIMPYIGNTTLEHLEQGFLGISMPSGRTYKGLNELLTEIQWHFDNSIWNTTMEIYENSNEITLELFGE